MQEFSPLDGVVLAILLMAVTRGFFIGLIRESFSIAALGGACVVVSYGRVPAALWLQRVSNGEVGAGASTWIAAAVLAIGTIVVVGTAGRWLRRGARAVGLGWADRLGGGALGAAEGALVVALLIVAASWLVGRDHPAIAQSRTIETYEELQSLAQNVPSTLPDVAAQPKQ
jgi:membrane protein required for colicin V production